jgi:hypothetical protein|tara:strand:- start:19776 stop:20591 length:816 start_codon:yes stop_codon:yes gene_type:complete
MRNKKLETIFWGACLVAAVGYIGYTKLEESSADTALKNKLSAITEYKKIEAPEIYGASLYSYLNNMTEKQLNQPSSYRPIVKAFDPEYFKANKGNEFKLHDMASLARKTLMLNTHFDYEKYHNPRNGFYAYQSAKLGSYNFNTKHLSFHFVNLDNLPFNFQYGGYGPYGPVQKEAQLFKSSYGAIVFGTMVSVMNAPYEAPFIKASESEAQQIKDDAHNNGQYGGKNICLKVKYYVRDIRNGNVQLVFQGFNYTPDYSLCELPKAKPEAKS